ncbi:Amiloride-sensitive sodium channel, partial [Teladorsagia circumcincta]
ELMDNEYDRDQRAWEALVLEAAKLGEEKLIPALYTFEDLITDCTFSGKKCSARRPHLWREISFRRRERLVQELPSSRKEYIQPLTTTELTSAWAIKRPSRSFRAFQTKTQRLKSPYPGRCVDGEPDATNFYKSLRGDQSSSTPNICPLDDCSCGPPCSEISYLTTASVSKFPAEGYFVATDPVESVDQHLCRNWYEENALLLQVFFETLKYESYTEIPSYGISAVLNDLGGQAGLWLGLSVISVIEDQHLCRDWYEENALLLQVFFETLKYESYTEIPSYGISAVLNDLGGQAGLWLGLSVISVIEVGYLYHLNNIPKSKVGPRIRRYPGDI